MKYEKPQKGNPRKLTVRQHVLPKASIARFANKDGQVSLFRIKNRDILLVNPSADIFCVKRIWDQRAESGDSKRIEDRFQVLADNIVSGKISDINSDQKHIVNSIFALWHMRSKLRMAPLGDQSANGLVGPALTKEEEESLEANHYTYVRSNGAISGRQMAGLHIQIGIMAICRQMSDALWGIVRADSGEFIVPDHCPDGIIPLSPTISLVNPSKSGVIPREGVEEINRYMLEASSEYYFARDISKCLL